MRSFRLVLALSVAAALPLAIAGCGCPTALISGVLVAQGDELAVEAGSGDIWRVTWPFGYGVREEGETLVLTNLLGAVEAREGDYVDLGGGQTADDRFGVCGQLNVRRST